MNTLYQFWSPSHSTLWFVYRPIYMRKLKNFNNKSIYWLKRMYYTHLSSFLFHRYEKWFTYYYSKLLKVWYLWKRIINVLQSLEVNKILPSFTFVKKIIRTFKFFLFLYNFFFERESIILILFYVCHIYNNFILFFPYLADG